MNEKIKEFIDKLLFEDIKCKKGSVSNRIFLCGGSVDQSDQFGKDSIRHRLYWNWDSKTKDLVLLAEDVIKSGDGQNFKADLLLLENFFAILVYKIALICESPGSIAELGVFVLDELSRKKLFLGIKEKYYSGKEANSFIRRGPIKHYEDNSDGTPSIFVLSKNASLDELKEIEQFFVNSKIKDFSFLIKNNKHFSIFVLLDLIKLMVIAEKTELKKSFEYFFKCSKYDYAKEVPKYFDDMLLILEKFDLIQFISRGTKQFYIATDKKQTTEYRNNKEGLSYNSTQEPELSLDSSHSQREYFPHLQRELMHEIYGKNGLANSILKEKKDDGQISWLHTIPDLHEADTRTLRYSAPLQYKVYYIPKKKGEKREIAQPTPKLKELQRATVEELYDRLPVHESSKAYQKNQNGIFENAKAHQQNNFFYKFDFKNFFPSIKAIDFYNYLTKKHSFSENDALELCVIFFRFDKLVSKEIRIPVFQGFRMQKRENSGDISIIRNLMLNEFPDVFQLSVGAPSSPFVSNVIMHEFDEKIYQWAKSEGLIYTRYADDLTFSSETKIDILRIEENINSTLAEIDYLNLQLHGEKQKYLSFKTKVQITGINITPDHKLSIGRKKKREIRAKLHAFSSNGLNEDEINQLRGWLAVAKSLERTFFDAMVRRYGERTVSRLLKIE